MDSIRIAFIDLDGTLLSPDHETITPRTANALHAVHEGGLILAVATGRSSVLLPPSITAQPFDYYLTSNGADTCRTRDGAHINQMPLMAADAKLAWSLLKPFDFFVEWYIDGNIGIDAEVCERLVAIDMPRWHHSFFETGKMLVLRDIDAYLAGGAPGLEKINIVRCDDIEKRAEAIRLLEQYGRFALSSSLGRNLEINSLGCTKGSAIERLCEQIGIPTAQAMAFGDGLNDLEMLTSVGLGIAMGNAAPCVRETAAAVTETNEKDGVASMLEQWLKARRGRKVEHETSV